MVHDLREVSLWCLHQDMIVVTHHAINMDNCPIAKSGGFKIGKELLAVLLAFEHIL